MQLKIALILAMRLAEVLDDVIAMAAKWCAKGLCPTRETPDDSSCTLQRYARNDLHTCRDVTNCDRTTLRPWGMYKQCIQ